MHNDLFLLHFSISIILGALQVFKKETPIQSWGQSPLVALPSPLTWEKKYNLLLHWIGNQKNCKKDHKHLMTGPEGNSEFCFPRISIEIRGKQNSLFPKGPVIK